MLFTIRKWLGKKLISRVKFKKWLELEDIRSQIKDAVDQGKNDRVSSLLCSYLSIALCRGKWEKLPWEGVLNDYSFAVSLHTPSKDFRIFSGGSGEKTFLVNDSSWYSWASMLAKEYGWGIEYVAELDIDDAISLIQEVLYSDQVQKEWEWVLSERAIQYDKDGKGKYKPLDRPKWLLPIKEEIRELPKVKILRSMIPPGTVIRWDDSNVKH